MIENLQINVNDTGTLIVARNLQHIGNVANTTNNQLITTNNIINNLNRSTNALGNNSHGILALTGSLIGIAMTAEGLIKTADAYTLLQNKLRNVSDTAPQLEELTLRMAQLANETRSPIEATVTSFARFDNALKGLGKSQEDTIRLQKTINELLTLGGATTAEQSSALIQLSQAFNSGRLAGQEFNTVSESMPKIVRTALAETLGIHESQLKKAGADSKITSDIMYKAFLSLAEKTDATFNSLIPTISSSFVVLKNNLIVAFGEFNKATGLSEGFARGILWLSQNLDVLTVALAGIASVMLVSFAPAMLRGATAVSTFTVALMTNPLGLFVVALGVGVAALAVFGDDITVTTDKLNKTDLKVLNASTHELKENATEAERKTYDLETSLARVDSVKLDGINHEVVTLTKGLQTTDEINISLKNHVLGYVDAMAASFSALGNLIKNTWTSAVNWVNSYEMMPNTKKVYGAVGSFLTGDIGGESAIEKRRKLDAAGYKPPSLDTGFAAYQQDAARQRQLAEMKRAAVAAETPSALRGTSTPAPHPIDDKKKDKKLSYDERRAKNELDALTKLNAGLLLQSERQYEVAHARELNQKLDEISVKYSNVKDATGLALIANIKKTTTELYNSADAQKEFDAVVATSSTSSMRSYTSAVNGVTIALESGAVSREEANIEFNKLEDNYKNNKNAVLDYIDTLRLQNDELQNAGAEGGILNEVNAALKQQGLLGEHLTDVQREQIKTIEDLTRANQFETMVQEEKTRMLGETVDMYSRLEAKRRALVQLKDNPDISEGYKQRQGVNLQVEGAKTRLNSANYGSGEDDGAIGNAQQNSDVMLAAGGKILEGYQGVATGISDSFGNMFVSLNDGFANAVGHAIVQGDSLRDTFSSIAISIATELVSSLVKVGVQYMLNATIFSAAEGIKTGAKLTADSTMTASGLASMAITEAASIASAIAQFAAWLPTALTASVGSFGAAAVIGGAALLGAWGIAKAVGVAHDGIDNIPREGTWLLDEGERVVDKRTNGDLKNFLSNPPKNTNAGNKASGITVIIEDHGTSKSYDVQQMSETEVRIIARDESRKAVAKLAPDAVAGAIANPNSSMSKAIGRNTQAPRNRI